jgi:hypothetical protein
MTIVTTSPLLVGSGFMKYTCPRTRSSPLGKLSCSQRRSHLSRQVIFHRHNLQTGQRIIEKFLPPLRDCVSTLSVVSQARANARAKACADGMKYKHLCQRFSWDISHYLNIIMSFIILSATGGAPNLCVRSVERYYSPLTRNPGME